MNNWATRLYPSTKVLFVLLVIVLGVMVPGYTFQYSIFPFMIIVALLSQCAGKFLSLFMKSIFVIVLFIFVIQVCIIKNGDEQSLFAFLHFSKIGLDTSLNMTSKIVAISSSVIWFFQVTSVKDIIYSMEKINAPRKMTFVIASTIQLIPQMTALSKTITDAQKSRGIETEGNVLVRAKAFVPMLGPLVLSSIQQIEERVLALESRAFSATGRKTSFYSVRKTVLDYILVILMLVGFIAYLWIGGKS
ncbi:energy-coupling factor transport system permease protein [Pilibacter termitis]|uniref:Energy-coupling factor transport system permease protein n=1 Tax=Pilibacter termitis TaxID=263852 RepID=A0A1T4LX47_9ENTE|nr:energy-coupling factor transporter transmembrane component T [Pilibacter termitis]SJZ59245.1 energy-coupling factor transport system permease protein [Pilibacter termitis]